MAGNTINNARRLMLKDEKIEQQAVRIVKLREGQIKEAQQRLHKFQGIRRALVNHCGRCTSDWSPFAISLMQQTRDAFVLPPESRSKLEYKIREVMEWVDLEPPRSSLDMQLKIKEVDQLMVTRCKASASS